MELQDQILILDGDLFTSQPLTILKKVEQFLEVPQFFQANHFDFTGTK